MRRCILQEYPRSAVLLGVLPVDPLRPDCERRDRIHSYLLALHFLTYDVPVALEPNIQRYQGEEQDDRATGSSSPRSARSCGGCWERACVEGIFDYRTGEVPVLLHASARRAASSKGVSSSGNSFRIRSSRAIVGLRSPSTSGRATDALTGVTRFSQSEER